MEPRLVFRAPGHAADCRLLAKLRTHANLSNLVVKFEVPPRLPVTRAHGGSRTIQIKEEIQDCEMPDESSLVFPTCRPFFGNLVLFGGSSAVNHTCQVCQPLILSVSGASCEQGAFYCQNLRPGSGIGGLPLRHFRSTFDLMTMPTVDVDQCKNECDSGLANLCGRVGFLLCGWASWILAFLMGKLPAL
jgi:hypothetical protein